MGKTKRGILIEMYYNYRSNGMSHAECVELFKDRGLDIERVQRLSSFQRHFGEHWIRNTVIGVVLGLFIVHMLG